MISWATIRDGDIDSAGRSDGQTEEAAVHAYRSQYGEALNLILKGQLAPSRLILNQILSDMEASRFKDVQIKFLTLANLSRVYEREHNMTEAYIAILHAAELNPGDANIITRAALLGSQLGDTWTSRALLNCEAFRQGGMLCMEELILDNCTKVYQDQFQSLPTLRKCMQVTLTVYSDECDLRSFVEQLCCAELWQCDEVIIQRVSAASRSLLDSAAIDITDAADVSRSDHSSGVMGIETAQQTMAMAGILGCALGVDGDSNSISTPPNEANKSEAANTRRSKRNSSKFTENSNGVPKAVGLVENIEVN